MASTPRAEGTYIKRRAARGRRFFSGFDTPRRQVSPETDFTPLPDHHPALNAVPASSTPGATAAHYTYDDYDRAPRGGGMPATLSALVIVIALFAVVGVLGLGMYQAHEYGFDAGYNQHAADFLEKKEANARLATDRLESEAMATAPWISRVQQLYVAERKISAVPVDSTAADHAYLGLYETFGLDRPAEGALHMLLGSIRGSDRAAVLLLEERKHLGAAQETTFERLHQISGGRGYLYLGQYYSYGRSYFVQQPTEVDEELLEVTLASDAPAVFGPDYPRAFRYFHVATLCGVPNAYRWRNEIAQFAGLSDAVQSAERGAAERELGALAERAGGDRAALCAGGFLETRLARLQPAMLIEDGRLMTLDDLLDTLWLDESRFAAWTSQRRDALSGNDTVRGSVSGRDAYGGPLSLADTGSKLYRDNPGGAVPREEATLDGLPAECRTSDPPAECSTRLEALQCTDRSRYNFSRGEAEMALGNLDEARGFFNAAITIGRTCGSEYAVMSSKRLGALNLTCEYTPASLRRIARNDPATPGTDVIDLRIRQRALGALGHYRGNVDGKYGPQTRTAITEFQREFGFRETGDLTPIETVYLVCGAAEIARDVDAYTALGLMYVTGLGTVQNTDLGLQWLRLAARAGDADALYNLAILYGSGTVLSSYLVCDVAENELQADAYLEEAARAGHPVAVRLVRAYGDMTSDARWAAIRDALGLDGEPPAADDTTFERRLENVGYGCRPTPS